MGPRRACLLLSPSTQSLRTWVINPAPLPDSGWFQVHSFKRALFPCPALTNQTPIESPALALGFVRDHFFPTPGVRHASQPRPTAHHIAWPKPSPRGDVLLTLSSSPSQYAQRSSLQLLRLGVRSKACVTVCIALHRTRQIAPLPTTAPDHAPSSPSQRKPNLRQDYTCIGSRVTLSQDGKPCSGY